jgi:hypothetical protein
MDWTHLYTGHFTELVTRVETSLRSWHKFSQFMKWAISLTGCNTHTKIVSCFNPGTVGSRTPGNWSDAITPVILFMVTLNFDNCVCRWPLWDIRSRCSSVNIVSGYGLDDRAIEVRSPAGAEDFSSSLCVQTGSGVHPASCPKGTGGKEWPGCDADHPTPSSAEVVNEKELYILSPQKPPWRVAGLHTLYCPIFEVHFQRKYLMFKALSPNNYVVTY